MQTQVQAYKMRFFQKIKEVTLLYPDESLIVLSRKRLICFVFNKNVETSKVAAYCVNMILVIRENDAHFWWYSAKPLISKPLRSIDLLNEQI